MKRKRAKWISSSGHAASLRISQDFEKRSALSLTGTYLDSTTGQQRNMWFGWQFDAFARDIEDAYDFDYVLHHYALPCNMLDGTVRPSTCIGPDGIQRISTRSAPLA